MIPDLLLIFVLQTTGWMLPLGVLIGLATHANIRRGDAGGLRRIVSGSAIVIMMLVLSSFWLSITGRPSTDLHLIAHSLTIGGLVLVVLGAREVFREWRSTISFPRIILATIAAALLIAVLNDVALFQFESNLVVDGLLNAIILGILAAFYMSFGGIILHTNTARAWWYAPVCFLAGALTLLAIPPHSFVAARVGLDWLVPVHFLRGGFITLAGLMTLGVYRLAVNELFPEQKQPTGEVLHVSTKLLLQQRVVYLVAGGLMAIGVGAVLITENIRSSIESVEHTYLAGQEHVARSVAVNFEGLANDIRSTLENLAMQQGTQRLDVRAMRSLFGQQYQRWQNILSAFSRVDERGILRYTYPERPENIGSDLTSQHHVRAFLRTQKPLLSGVFHAVQGYETLALYVPVFRTERNDRIFAGGMAALIRTDAFSDRAFRNVSHLSPNPVAALNHQGQIIAASDTSFVGKSGSEYLKAVFPLPLHPDTLVVAAAFIAQARQPSLLQVHTEDPMEARRWIIVHPVHLAGEPITNVLVAVRNADVVSFYATSVNRQIALWGTFTLILVLTMGGIVAMVYRWSRFLEDEVNAKLAIIREREERLQTILDTEPECVKIVDSDGRVVQMNPAGLRMIEANSLEDVRMKSVYALVAPEYRDAFRALIASALAGKGGMLEYEIVGLRGTRRWLETNMVPLPPKPDEEATVLGITRDVTERHRAHEAIRESEERYRSLFEESKDAVCVSTAEGKLLDINPAGVELFGYASKEEMLRVDIPHDLYIDPKQRETFRRLLEERGSVKDIELRLRRRDGQEIIALETATCVRDAQGKVVAYRGIIRDVTTQRRLEEEIRQAQKMEGVGLLAGGIAHDFNNLLGGILGYASYLKTKMTEDHPFYRQLDTIERSALRAADLTAKLLAFARGGRYDVKPINFNTIVKETVSILERTIDRAITIETILDEQLPSVEGDHGQLQQVLMNLCVNARDAITGGGRITVETSRAMLDEEFVKTHLEAHVGEYVTVTVSDTGTGMDKSTLRRIFDPFFTTKEKGKGTGLGLSMVYGIVKAHGGFIRVYSEPGHGSTFRVYFPASKKEVMHQESITDELRGGTETILVVDDEEHVRALVSDILQSAGYHVLTAADGQEALDLYRQHREEIAVVILDMIMPRLGGKETFRSLREMNPGVKVLLSSGYSENGAAREILESGTSGFLQKPYRSAELLKKLRQVIDHPS